MLEKESERVAIRPATSADIPDIQRLYGDMDRVHHEGRPDMFHSGGEPARPQDFIESLLANPDALLLVVDGPNGAVAFAEARFVRVEEGWIDTERRFVKLESLGVSPAHRRQGLGRALVHEVEAWAKERGARGVELNVFAFNVGARAVYERLGYLSRTYRMEKRLL